MRHPALNILELKRDTIQDHLQAAKERLEMYKQEAAIITVEIGAFEKELMWFEHAIKILTYEGVVNENT